MRTLKPPQANDLAILERLRAYRLSHDLTYEQLSDQMAERGFAVRPRALHFALAKRLIGVPRERTLYKIEQFLNRLDPETEPTPTGDHQSSIP